MNPLPPPPDAPGAPEAIRVLVADDHLVVREGLASIIGRQPDMAVAGMASDGAETVQLWRQHRPDVVLVDLRMPRLDGVGAIEEIRRRDPGARLVVLTTFDSDVDLTTAIKAGARGYLLKDAPREELLACIRRVHAGEMVLSPVLVGKLAAGMSAAPLTGRELEVLGHLALGRSNKQLATILRVGETTVKSHLRSIFSKLRVASRTEAVAEAGRRGLVAV